MSKRKARWGGDKERAQILRKLLKYTREQWDGWQAFLSCTQGIIESYPGGSFAKREEPLAQIIDEVGWADNCQDCLVGDVFGTLREIDGKLVEGLALLGKTVDTLDERRAKKVARAKRARARRRAKSA